MALSLKLTEGSLYIDREKDFLSNEWGPYVKLGIVRGARDVSQRSKEHQTGNPRQIIAMKIMQAPMIDALESQLHQRFARHRVSGEWFLLDEDMINQHVIPIASDIIRDQERHKSAFETHQQLKVAISTDAPRPATPTDKKLHAEITEVRKQIMQEKALRDIAKQKLLDCLGTAGGIKGIVELQIKAHKPQLNKKQLIEDQQGLCKDYLSEESDSVSGSLKMLNIPPLAKIDSDLKDLAKTYKDRPDLNPDQGKQPVIDRTDVAASLHLEYLNRTATLSTLECEDTLLLAQLASEMGTAAGIKGIATWQRDWQKQEKFDAERFSNDHPEIYQQYLSQAKQSIAVVVNPCRPYQ